MKFPKKSFYTQMHLNTQADRRWFTDSPSTFKPVFCFSYTFIQIQIFGISSLLTSYKPQVSIYLNLVYHLKSVLWRYKLLYSNENFWLFFTDNCEVDDFFLLKMLSTYLNWYFKFKHVVYELLNCIYWI